MDVVQISVRKAVPDICVHKLTHVFIIMMPGNQYRILFCEKSKQRCFINSVYHRKQWLSSSEIARLVNIFNLIKYCACK
jgi:hypothetical protein